MKLLNFFCLIFFLISNPAIAETVIAKSEILKKSDKCLNDFQKYECKKLISQMERFQLLEVKQNRFKCQSSILGLQTEIVEANFFQKSSKLRKSIMIPYVIKNC